VKLVVACLTTAVVTTASAVHGATGTRTTSTMSTPRYQASATELADGRVLIAGGAPTSYSTDTVEFYDPVTGQISPGPSMLDRVDDHTAIRLPDGRVLVAGGIAHRPLGEGGVEPWRRAEVFDPTSGARFRVADLPGVRWRAGAALLPDGRALLVGGDGGYERPGVPLATTVIYDPVTASWSDGPPMSTPRSKVKVLTLPDGRIMAAGNRSAEILDTTTMTWSPAGTVGDAEQRPAITLLSDGRVFYAGAPSSSIYDPSVNAWTPAAPFTGAHTYADAMTLGDGRVWVPGGFTAGITTEVYDPATDTWSAGARLQTARQLYTALTLSDGTALVVGGAESVSIPYETQVADVDRFRVDADTPEAPALIVPSTKTDVVNGVASLGVLLRDDASGARYPGVSVSFAVVSGPHAGDAGACVSTCVTNQFGNTSWSLAYRGPRGTDTVDVWADMDGDGIRSAADPGAIATIEWLQRPTGMSARPALVQVTPDGSVRRSKSLAARLTSLEVALPGKRVDFTAKAGELLCSGTTDANGVAACGGTNEQIAAARGYTATFAGDDGYLGSSANATIVAFR
jgi:hypothetical protein